MLEKGKQSESFDYFDGLPEDFKDYINETKIINETKKSDRFSSRSNNSDESLSSIEKKINKNIIKTFNKINIEQNDSEDIFKKMESAEKNATSSKKDLNKSKKELKNIKIKIKKIYTDQSYGIDDFQPEELNEEHFEGLYDYSNNNVELNPKYEEAQYYDEYLNDEDQDYDNDLPNDDQEYYNDVHRENVFINKNPNDNFNRDLI